MDRSQLKEDLLRSLVIAIDGPAGSGKSTTARLAAERLGYRQIDTGAMYRAVTLKAIEQGLDPEDGERIGSLAAGTSISMERAADGTMHVWLDGRDVTREIRTPEVTRQVSPVSAHPSVRRVMVREQRRLSESGGVILDGRDIGSVVLPHADIKAYMDASPEVRARRRLQELTEKGIKTSLAEVESDIERRDRYDSSRADSPLTAPVGAWILDTTELTVAQQVEKVVSLAKDRAGELAERIVLGRRKVPVEKIRPLYRFGQEVILLLLKGLWGIRIDRKEQRRFNENYIFVCNHRAFADPPLVGSTIRREVHFLAKDDLFRNPLFAGLIRAFNAIPLKRLAFDRSILRKSMALLEEGQSILLFPEGHRIFTMELGKPMSGIGYLAVKSGVPVFPLYVDGSNRLRDCLLRKQRLIVKQGRPLRLTDPSISRTASGDDYRNYSDTVMASIQALKDELAGERPA